MAKLNWNIFKPHIHFIRICHYLYETL